MAASPSPVSRPVPPSPHFRPVDLRAAFTARRSELPPPLRTPFGFEEAGGVLAIRGIPFLFGDLGDDDVVLLDTAPVAFELGNATPTYLLVVHTVEDVVTRYLDGYADMCPTGMDMGSLVSEYRLEYEDGSNATVPVRRRFAIQQGRWRRGSSSVQCVVAADEGVYLSSGDSERLNRPAAVLGRFADTRARSGLDEVAFSQAGGPILEALWLYAVENPHPSKPIARLTCLPRTERSVIYAVTLTDVVEHPLRANRRRKLLLQLPEGVELNAIGELDDVHVDLGTVISARAALSYEDAAWASGAPEVQPRREEREVVVEFAAHSQAYLYVGDAVFPLDQVHESITVVASAERPVRLRFVDKESGERLAVRLHLHGAAGEYLPPRGYHRKVNDGWYEDTFAEFVNGANQYAYVDGECIADLPLGTVYFEATRGFEVAPVRASLEVTSETDEVTIELERMLRWRERGWVTADTHVHFLSPQTALLEGRAEGVNVVNVLASQWGEMFSSVGDFDGKTTFGAEDLGGRGEFLVRVGSENRTHVLGHISLLGYQGELIFPLCTGGPTESAHGDPLEVAMAEWAQRCIDQGGLVVLPHAPVPQLERAADIVLGLVDAVEWTNFNPLEPREDAAFREIGHYLSTYGIADWYRFLNLGYHVPLVGGTDKMSARMLLGGIRTYARIGERELDYEAWMAAVKKGDTFATIGPLVELAVEGVEPGGRVELPRGGGSVEVEWLVESVRVPIEAVEVIVGGLVAEEVRVGGELATRGRASIPAPGSTWIAVRVRGSYVGDPEEIAAHTSAVQVVVEGSPLFSEADSIAILDQIEGTLAYVDTIAARAGARRHRAIRAQIEAAYNRLHQQMHANGVHCGRVEHDSGGPHGH
jgi:hypothetical protein